MDIARQLGGGNASAGIRIALDSVPLLDLLVECYERGDFSREAEDAATLEKAYDQYKAVAYKQSAYF